MPCPRFDISYDYFGRSGRLCQSKGMLRRCSFHDREPVIAQTLCDELADERFIIDDQHIHLRHPPAFGSSGISVKVEVT